MVPVLLTFVAAILAMLAIIIVPGSKAIKEGAFGAYKSWGKGLAYILGLVTLGVGGYVVYNWYVLEERGVINTMNMALFVVLGIGIVINNAWVSRSVTKAEEKEGAKKEEKAAAVEAESAPSKKVAVKKAPAKKAVKKTPAKKVVKKAPTKTKAAARPRPAKPAAKAAVKKGQPAKKAVKAAPRPKVASEELIEPVAAPPKKKRGKTCPSCDTPLDHHHVGECPVCGEDITG